MSAARNERRRQRTKAWHARQQQNPLCNRLYDEAANSGKHMGPRCRIPGGGSAHGRKAGGIRNLGGDIVAAYVDGDRHRREWIECFNPKLRFHGPSLSPSRGRA